MQVAIQPKPVRNRRNANRESAFNSDLLVRLHELLQGERSTVKIFSKALNEEIEFVNPLTETVSNSQSHPVYTTRELSFILSMSSDELRRYHYFKTRLV